MRVFDEQQEPSLLAGTNNAEIEQHPPLRVLRRITYDTVDQLKKLERLANDAKLDLEPSVYLVPLTLEHGVVQMHAEHLSVLTNAPSNQPRWHVDASRFPHRGLVRQRGETKFVFTQQAHACLTLANEADVDAFATAILSSLPAAVEVPMADVRRYARGRYDVGDTEWHEFVNGGDSRHQKAWLKWIQKT